MRQLGDPLLKYTGCIRKFQKRNVEVTTSLLQQRYSDRIDAVVVTGYDGASAVRRKIAPVFCGVHRVKAEHRTGQEHLGIESLRVGGVCFCFEAGQTLCRDGSWALGALILDES